MEIAVLDDTPVEFFVDEVEPPFDKEPTQVALSGADYAFDSSELLSYSNDDLIAEAQTLEFEDVSETPVSEIERANALKTETDYYFDLYGVYINGERCISVDNVANLPQEFLSRVADAQRSVSAFAVASNEQNGYRGGGGDSELEEVDIELGITYARACGSSASLVNATTGISEGHSPYSEYKTTAEYLTGDYMAVELPALPIGYESQVTFAGSATFGADYVTFVSYPPSFSSLNPSALSFDHSGGSSWVYIFPVEDAQQEFDETATLIFGTPRLQGSGGTDTHAFNMLVGSATATIIDNDHWQIVATPEPAYANLNEIVVTESNQAGENEPDTNKVSFTVSRVDDSSNRSGDNHYPIAVSLRFQNGTATYDDYKILHHEPSGAVAWLTPNLNNEVCVVIPAGADSTTITIEALDDSIVERLYETLSFNIVNAWNTSNSFTYDNTSRAIKVKDNDALYLDTVQYLDNIDLVSDTQETFGTHWGNSIHWVNNYSQYTLPVAYSSDAYMKCESKTLGNIDPNVDITVRFSWEYTDIDGAQRVASSNWSPRQNSNGMSVGLLSGSFVTLLGGESAYYDLSSTLTWEFRVNGEDRGEQGVIAQSVNPLYVTYKPPVGYSNGIYHSVIDIGCRAAHRTRGGANEQAVFDKIWDKFETLSINKVELVQGSVCEGELLMYYGKEVSSSLDYWYVNGFLSLKKVGEDGYSLTQLPTLARELDVMPSSHYPIGWKTLRNPHESVNHNSTDSLLRFKDGLCTTWSTFARDIFAAQGISVSYLVVGVANNPQSMDFQIKNNVRGQGNIVPFENTWQRHCLISYNGSAYDPSYGASYGVTSSFLTVFVERIDSIGHTIPADGIASRLHYGMWYIPDKTWTNDEIDATDFDYVEF